MGQQLFEDFDSVEFREYCNDSELIPDVVQLSESLGEVLEDEHKELIMNYLRDISEVDGNVSGDEEMLLQKISTGLRVLQSKGGT